jgi:glycosyltransferase involved in cell wall biosynthesis
MRIGIDARLWNETGVGRYIRNLVWQLQKIDKKNEYVLFVSKSFKIEDLGSKNNLKVVTTDIRWHTLKEQLQFHNILDKEDLDLVHFPYFSVPVIYNKPFVITIHDLIINHYPTGKASTLPSPIYFLKLLSYKYIIKEATQKALKVISVSEATKEEVVQHLGVSRDKIVVTYEGVDFKGKAESREGNVIKKISPYFFYVGNAYPHKNLERLCDAFALILADHPEVKLLLVGKKNYFYNRLEEKVKKMNLDKSIIFTGSVRDEKLVSLYKNAKALILPSLMEGFGLPGLEAMQSGCLVLASDIPVFKEIYQDAAVYFDPLEVESMRVTILKVLERKKDFDSLIEKGKRQISTFSWEKMANQTLKIYESCLSIRQNK